MVDVQGSDIGPSAAAEVLVFDVHGGAWPAGLGGMLAATGLNARLFVGGNHELILLQRAALPMASVQIQDAASLAGEVRIAWKDPTAVIPGPNGILVKPAPQRTTADRGDQAALLDMLNQITGAPAGQRPVVFRRQFTRQGLNLNDEIWGKKSGVDPNEH